MKCMKKKRKNKMGTFLKHQQKTQEYKNLKSVIINRQNQCAKKKSIKDRRSLLLSVETIHTTNIVHRKA